MAIGKKIQDRRHLKTVFVDMDGTLSNSLPALFRVYNQFLRKHSFQGKRKEFEFLNGPSIPEIVSYLKDKYSLEGSISALFQEYQRLLNAHYIQGTSLFAGAKEWIAYAKERGLKLVLVTSASEELADSFLNAHAIRDDFAAIVTSEGLLRGKPDPAIYQKALSLANMNPSESLAIEDSLNGVEASLKVQIPTLWIFAKNQKIIKNDLLESVDNWAEILSLFRIMYEPL